MSQAVRFPTPHARNASDAAPAPPQRTLVIGLGNSLLCDDAVGLHIAAALRGAVSEIPEVEVAEDHCGGLRLMERLVGYDRAVVVDAARTGAAPGTLHLLPVGAPTEHCSSSHDVDLPTAMELGRRSGAALPSVSAVRILAIEAAEVYTFSEECTPAVAASVPRAVDMVLGLLQAWR